MKAKKTMTALVLGTLIASTATTFAAANPFTDVSSEHWAYDAVAQLAKDGVVEGYGDGTYLGQRQITRYEMAQMVAKAMAKAESAEEKDRALIDKLSHEFSDELKSLGVRVSSLEDRVDNVKWGGQLEYVYQHRTVENRADDSADDINRARFRLEPTATVNDHWKVMARMDANIDVSKDTTDSALSLQRAWAEGNYKNFGVKLGKFAPSDNAFIMDTTMSGGEVLTTSGKATFTFGAGRQNLKGSGSTRPFTSFNSMNNSLANHYYFGIDYETGKAGVGASYHRLTNFSDGAGTANTGISTGVRTKDSASVGTVKAHYKITNDVDVQGMYAQSSKFLKNVSGDKDFFSNKAGFLRVQYKGAAAENKDSWGLWVGYRYTGSQAAWFTPEMIYAGEKTWEIGGDYTFLKNIVGTFQYAHGTTLSESVVGADKTTNRFYGKLYFLF